MKNLQFLFYFLTSKNRHFWRHHYSGAQGVILVFSIKAKYIPENLVIEVLSILKDQNLIGVPFLIIFDKSNIQMEENQINDKLISSLEELEVKEKRDFEYNLQFINFENNKGLDELNLGIDWLCEMMQSLTNEDE